MRLALASDGALSAQARAFEPVREPVRVCISSARVSSNDPFLRHKTSWRPAHRRAYDEAAARSCFDALLRNERGNVTEGSIANLFVEIGGQLCTPPLSDGLLPGILRATALMNTARERSISLDDLRRADAAFVGNSARGLLRAEVVFDP